MYDQFNTPAHYALLEEVNREMSHAAPHVYGAPIGLSGIDFKDLAVNFLVAHVLASAQDALQANRAEVVRLVSEYAAKLADAGIGAADGLIDTIRATLK